MRQFPSAMAIADTGDRQLARRIASATAEELSSCGINWVLGPVLDVLTNGRSQPLGVRSFGEDPAIVSKFGVETIKGLQEGGVATCGKHFPSYGNLEFFGAPTDVPTITDSLENLAQNALIPFKQAIDAGVDAIMVGGVAMSSNYLNVMHACLSEQICKDLLRTEMKFGGVILSECLEMEALSRNIGISGGTVMAFKAGCDIMLTCRSMSVQEEAINGLTAGLENGIIEKHRVQESFDRVLAMKRRYTSWDKVYAPPGVQNLDRLQATHSKLSAQAYKNTIRVARDTRNLLPLSRVLLPEQELLLLTPLVRPLPTSATFRQFAEELYEVSLSPRPNYATDGMVMTGEKVFRNFGRLMASGRQGKVLHASYTANGVRPQHEALLDHAKAVVVLTADAGRNKYQAAFAKHIAMLCRMNQDANGRLAEKPCIIAAVSSPFDFATDMSIGTYLCTYDFTETALQALIRLLYAEQKQEKQQNEVQMPIKTRRASQARQQWLVENYREERDKSALNSLLVAASTTSRSLASQLKYATADTFWLKDEGIEEAHYVVRNSSTKELIGFCATYFSKADNIGSIGAIIVHPNRRNQSVGHSLHDRAVRALLKKSGLYLLQLGTRLPNVFPGLPSSDAAENEKLSQWFTKLGWLGTPTRQVNILHIADLSSWEAPEGLGKSLTLSEIKYDLVHGDEYTDSIMAHIDAYADAELRALYRIALSNKEGCAIIRGKRSIDGSVVATVLLYRSQSSLAPYVPYVQSNGNFGGGIGSAVLAPDLENKAVLLQGLILLGVRQLKKQGMKSIMLDYVSTRFHALCQY